MGYNYSWSGLGDGTSWNDPNNWVGGPNPQPDGSSSVPPDATDNVNILAVVTIDDAGTAGELEFTSLTINDSLNVSGSGTALSSIGSPGALFLGNGATVTVSGGAGIGSPTLGQSATFTVNSGGLGVQNLTLDNLEAVRDRLRVLRRF
jgi:hypothetical protein